MKREKTNVISNSSKIITAITEQHEMNSSLAICITWTVYYSFADFTSPFNATVNCRKASQ